MKKFILVALSALALCSCAKKPVEIFVPKGQMEFAGSGFDSFSPGADVRVYMSPDQDNPKLWNIQAVVPVRKETDTGMRYAFIIGFPCSVGMSVLSKQIVSFFYSNVKEFTPDKIQLASELLTFSAMTVVLFTVVQATSSILQGLRKQKIPM